jgi:hypothetical protein
MQQNFRHRFFPANLKDHGAASTMQKTKLKSDV